MAWTIDDLLASMTEAEVYIWQLDQDPRTKLWSVTLLDAAQSPTAFGTARGAATMQEALLTALKQIGYNLEETP